MAKSFECEISRAGGALIAKVRGLYNAAAAHEVREEIRAEVADRHAVKILLDLRQAVLLLDEETSGRLMNQFAHDPIMAPMGVLVDPIHEQRVWRDCMSLMHRGHIRLPFVDPRDAERWLGVHVPQLRPTREFQPRTPAA